MTAENESRLPGHPYVPSGPLEDGPPGGYQPPQERREALAAVLDGIPLGAYDRRVLDWLAGLDDPTCRTLASVMLRCRLAAPPGSVTEWALAYTHRLNVREWECREIQPYPDEQSARRAVADIKELAPEDEPRLARHEVSPWEEVPDA